MTRAQGMYKACRCRAQSPPFDMRSLFIFCVGLAAAAKQPILGISDNAAAVLKDANDDATTLATGALVAIIVGAVAGLCCIVAITYMMCRVSSGYKLDDGAQLIQSP